MKKTFRPVVQSFLAHQSRTIGNTSTDGEHLLLYGNCIARHADNTIEITTASWNTSTTRDRLNGLPGVRVSQRNYQLLLDGQPWSGEWTKVRKH